MLFHAADPGHGSDLWITDGTVSGTTVVRNAPTSSDAGYFDNVSTITALGATSLAIFQASESTHGKELWVTDGTSAGTSMLRDINPGLSTSNTANITALGTSGKAIFTADTGSLTNQLWVTDGTTAGTSLLLANRGTNGYFFSTVNNKGIFGTSDGHIWSTDGTSAGTIELISTALFNISTYPTPVNGKVIFSANPSGFNPTLWATDGTVSGTVHLSTTVIVSGSLTTTAIALGNQLLFAGSTSSGNELWSTDGTALGTGLVFDINTNGSGASSNPQNFAVIGNKALFSAADGTHGVELWASDGTFFGTTLVKDIRSAISSQDSNPTSLGAVNIACFAAGTKIATDHGECPVETLQVGDLVQLSNGTCQPITWIGRRTLDITRHPRPHDVAPIRVAAHAFGAAKPHTDLYLSPDHAIHSHDVLIPIRHLVNGTTIARQEAAEITYYHIELRTHDVLLAEGLACESYLDGGDTRDAFEGGAVQILHPVFSHPSEAAPCAPVVTQGVVLQSVRTMVARQAASLGEAMQIAG